MPTVTLPAPVALARLTDTLTPVGATDYAWEPKWDGYRVIAGGGRIYSRRATDLTPLFPDVAPALRARIPDGAVLDGEMVCFNAAAGRLDFAALQSRMTAGRRLRSVVDRHPAQYVAFDVLAAGGEDLRDRPLRERRKVLEQLLAGIAAPIVLCQQTTDVQLARRWYDDFQLAGLEGLVVKDRASTYPTRDGQRTWWKVKAKTTLDMLAIGYTGTPAAPTTLVLAFPGQVDQDGAPVTAGATTILTKAAIQTLTPLLHPTGDLFERTFAWGAKEPSVVTVVEPFVVEVQADASAQTGVLRHGAKLHRPRPDLDPREL